jgi:RNA polymerase sigma-70 factor (ECF subfamily)
LKGASPTRGRFRWFLLAAFKHFLANEWDRARAQKRGGAKRLISFDELDPEQRYRLEPADGLSADKIYDRAWALMLLDKTRARLREEFSAAARRERFEILEQFLPGEASSATYAEIATRLGVAEGTVKSDVSRLRRRYGEVVREELAHTMGNQTDLDDELRHLFHALSQPA